MGDPPMIYDPPPRMANAVQGTSVALGILGLAMTAAGASDSTTENVLKLGHDAVVQAGMFFGFSTIPGSLRWGIVVTAVSVALNIYSLLLRYQYDSRRAAEAERATAASRATPG